MLSTPHANTTPYVNTTPQQFVTRGGRHWNLHSGSGSAVIRIRVEHGNAVTFACSGQGDATFILGAATQTALVSTPGASSSTSECDRGVSASRLREFYILHGSPDELPVSADGRLLVAIEAPHRTRWAFAVGWLRPPPLFARSRLGR